MRWKANEMMRQILLHESTELPLYHDVTDVWSSAQKEQDTHVMLPHFKSEGGNVI